MNNDNKDYESRRNRAKLFHSVNEGIKSLRNPLRIIPLLILTVIFTYAWNKKEVLISRIMTFELLDQLVTYAVCILIIVVFILLLIWILALLGRPFGAGEIEADVASAFGVIKNENRYKRPFLISCKQIKGSNVMEYVFWSRWISLEKWQNPEIESDILTALNCTRIEDYHYGGGKRKSKHIIVLRVTSGVEPPQKGELYDDEL